LVACSVNMLPSLLLFANLIIGPLARFSPGPKQRKYGRSLAPNVETRRALSPSLRKCRSIITPKIFIISMFDSEANVWYDNMPSILAKNITLPGVSPLYLYAHCTKTWGCLSADEPVRERSIQLRLSQLSSIPTCSI
jgi:hypothetical protein